MTKQEFIRQEQEHYRHIVDKACRIIRVVMRIHGVSVHQNPKYVAYTWYQWAARKGTTIETVAETLITEYRKILGDKRLSLKSLSGDKAWQRLDRILPNPAQRPTIKTSTENIHMLREISNVRDYDRAMRHIQSFSPVKRKEKLYRNSLLWRKDLIVREQPNAGIVEIDAVLLAFGITVWENKIELIWKHGEKRNARSAR